MKRQKFIFSAIVLLIMTAVFLTLGVSADSKSGSVGTVNWKINGSVMTLSGIGTVTGDEFYTVVSDNAVTRLVIEDGITAIDDYVFFGCDCLTSVVLPDSIASVGSRAFGGCPGLADAKGFVIVNRILFDYYGGEYNITVPDSVTVIDDYAFDSDSRLVSVVIPGNVKSIGTEAFTWCGNLTSVVMQEGVEVIGEGAFTTCDRLKSVVIPDSVKTISAQAFSYDPGLADENGFVIVKNVLYSYYGNAKNVVIPDGVTAIEGFAFGYYIPMTSVVIPDSVAVIESDAFIGCNGLTDVYYAGSQNQWNAVSVDGSNTRLTSAAFHADYRSTQTIGTPLGNVLYTDIVAYIDGYAIRSYNIDGYTYIVAEDLLNYGFEVTWDGINRRLTVGSRIGGITSTYQPEANTHIPGEIAMQYVYTDITTWFGGKQVTSYNIAGYTCIGMDDFAACYGDSYVWDNAARTLRMTVRKA